MTASTKFVTDEAEAIVEAALALGPQIRDWQSRVFSLARQRARERENRETPSVVISARGLPLYNTYPLACTNVM